MKIRNKESYTIRGKGQLSYQVNSFCKLKTLEKTASFFMKIRIKQSYITLGK